MVTLFEPTEINGLKLRNRFVRSATWEGMAADDGTCTPQLVDLYGALARGGIGLVIASHAYITSEGQATARQIGIYKDDLIAGLRRLTDGVHRHQCHIVAQLAHAGCFTSRKMTGSAPLAMSIVDETGRKYYREADTRDLAALSSHFAQAALRAREAGFDGVQLHAAHGYLLSQSLSPAYNRRDDRYGGSPENRMRLTLEALSAVRLAVGADFPVLIKLNCADFVDGGLTVEEALQIGRTLEDAGIDAIEVSGGTLVSGKFSPIRTNIHTEEKEAYFREAARRFKESLSVPIILVGGIRSPALAETLLVQGVADYFSMSRPLIREPGLVRRWIEGDLRKSACLSDNLCNQAARSGEGLHCVVERREKKNA